MTSIVDNNRVLYLDSNNFLHNLNNCAYYGYMSSIHGVYFIHGKRYTKDVWEVETNRLKILNSLED